MTATFIGLSSANTIYNTGDHGIPELGVSGGDIAGVSFANWLRFVTVLSRQSFY